MSIGEKFLIILLSMLAGIGLLHIATLLGLIGQIVPG